MIPSNPDTHPKDNLPILPFESGEAFTAWLLRHHGDSPGIWVRMYKKHTGRPSVTWETGVEAALAYGWIDGVRNACDDDCFIQRYTPRRPRGTWSKKNCLTAERLIAEGRMHAAGLAEVERAKADGRWERAYDSPKDMQLPADFLAELDRHPAAKTTFETLTKTGRYAIAFRLHNAIRPETRTRRLASLIAMLDEGRATL